MPVKFHDVNVGDIQARHGLADGQLNCCLSPLGGLVYLAPGDDPANFDSCVDEVHLRDPPGGHIDQVDRREYSGSTHSTGVSLVVTSSQPPWRRCATSKHLARLGSAMASGSSSFEEEDIHQ